MKRLATLVAFLIITNGKDAAVHSSSRHAPVAASGLKAAAAGPLRYDATNETTRSRSSQAMMDAIPQADREAFEGVLLRHIVAYSGELSRKNPDAPTIDG